MFICLLIFADFLDILKPEQYVTLSQKNGSYTITIVDFETPYQVSKVAKDYVEIKTANLITRIPFTKIKEIKILCTMTSWKNSYFISGIVPPMLP